MKSNNKIAFLNFYKHINKISSIKNIDRSANNLIPNNNQNFKFSLKKITQNNNNTNLYNIINQKEKLKFKTSKNTPNNSLKKIELNNINDNNNGGKESSEYNYMNNIDGVKTKLKINNNQKMKNKEIFDDYFIRKIRQVYSNKKKIFNNKIKKYETKSKSSNKNIFFDNVANYDSNKDNFLFDNTKTKLIKKKMINISEYRENSINTKNNLNLTNYMTKSKDFNSSIQHMKSNNEDTSNTNNFNMMNVINNCFSTKNNQNSSGIVFSNNPINNNIEKEKNVLIYNNLISPNHTSVYNTNSNTNSNTNKILVKYIENKYKNIISNNKAFLNNIKPEKNMFNNDNDLSCISNKNGIMKNYISNYDNHRSRSINRINNNILNINNYHILDNGMKKYATSSNSKNNSKKSTPNKIKLKIKYNNDDKNNIFISNINNNINIINDGGHFLSGKNTNKNLFIKYIKDKDNFIHRNNLYDSSKNISYNNLIYKYKNRNDQLFGDSKKNKNKSIPNYNNIDYTDTNNNNTHQNKNKTENSNIIDNNDIIVKNKENATDLNNSVKGNKNIEEYFNSDKNEVSENLKLLKEVILSSPTNDYKKNGIRVNGKKSGNLINLKNRDYSGDSASVIKVNCKYINKKDEKTYNKDYSNDEISLKKAKFEEKEKKNNVTSDSIINIIENLKSSNKYQLNDKKIDSNNFNQNKINNIKLEILNNVVENKKEEQEKMNNNKKIIFNDAKNDNIEQNNNKIDGKDVIAQNNNDKNDTIINIINNVLTKEENYNNDNNNNNKNIINNEKKNDISKKNKENNKEDKKTISEPKNKDKDKDKDKDKSNKEIISSNKDNNKIEKINLKINIENDGKLKDNNNNIQEIANNNNKKINVNQNISTQKKPQESDNLINNIITSNLEKEINKKQEDKKANIINNDNNNCNTNKDNNNNNINIINNYQHKSNKNNYEDFDYLLCDIRDKKENEDEKSVLTTQSRDCLYYQNELEKLSTFIKKYYAENDCYPESGIEFYLFGREIGHGAFGKVNLCLHIASGHLVAMKTFVKKDLKYKETKEKLRNEVEVLSKLHHPFINQILDSFETDTHFFIVMEYVCGDLLSFIRKRNKLNENAAKIIFKQIIEGLKYIHKKKIIHRDIKLDNLLIDLSNTIKICDFGVSRKIEKGNVIYERCGTPAYIAPEIYAKIGYEGCQCDIWSAGITLYYILSGTLPFRGSNIHELEKAVLKGDYEKIKDVSYEANDIIKGMLKIDPKKRLTIDEILKHPWLVNVNVENRYKLNIFTEAEKNILSKYDVDYLNSSKSDLIENFTYRNLIVEPNQKKIGGNTKSVIYAPYNSCVDDDSRDEEDDNINIISYLNKEEQALYDELEVLNDCCRFGWRVKQANINYELSNNDDYDNGQVKSMKDDDSKKDNDNSGKKDDGLSKNKTIDSVKDYEKIKIDKSILEYIEKNVGFDKKYLTKCLKKNIINYSTATYYLLYKEKMNEQKIINSSV